MTDLIIDDLKAVVRRHEASRPRSMQTDVGASEVGTPCNRRLAYKILGVAPVNGDTDPWPAIIGTATHTWLDEAFADENDRLGYKRWWTSVPINLGDWVRGTIDVYDALTATVIDHKVPGATGFKRAKAGPVSEQYRTQLHIYGAGLRMQGHDVNHVAIAYWSRGRLQDAFLWTEPYNEDIVETALTRVDNLRTTTATLGVDALPLIPTADAFCGWCPHYLPAVTDAREACPGHPGA